MVELVVNVEVFLRRLKTLYDRWKASARGSDRSTGSL